HQSRSPPQSRELLSNRDPSSSNTGTVDQPQAGHAQNPSHNRAPAGSVGATQPEEQPRSSCGSAAVTRAAPLDNRVDPPSYGSPASLPVATRHKSADSRSGVCSRPSHESVSAGRYPPGGDNGSARCSDPRLIADRLVADSAQSARPATGPPFVSPWALPVFCGDRFQRLDVQGLLRHHLFQPPVFVFEVAQLLHIADFESRILRPPLVESGIRNAVLAAELGDPDARLGILQDCDDLFLRVPFPCHGSLLWSPSQHRGTSQPMV